MRLSTFRPSADAAAPWRIGVGVGERIADLGVADALYREATRASLPDRFSDRFPQNLLELLRLEGPALPYTARVAAWLATQKGLPAHVSWDAGECAFDAPLRPGKLITVARNYHEHVAEHGLVHSGDVPSASIKASSSLSGPYDDIVRPAVEKQLDYETELAVVIGTRCKNVPTRDAYKVIAGYTVLSDIVARQVLKIERAAGNQFLGKMFDGFGPLGPWLVTKDEIPDPMNLRISTKVNGEARQQGNTSAMIWKIPQLIAYFSQATLEPGDIISTGTPAGVAAGRKPHETPWYLNPGDVIESEVEGIGRLRNRIVSDTAGAGDWSWKL
jgi:acylpyruvate hydrolase